MSTGFENVHQIATRKNPTGNADQDLGSGSGQAGSSESRLPVRLDFAEWSDDSLAGWLEAYFAVEVTTAASSRAVQRRDLTRFVRFMLAEEGSDQRSLWTSRLSRAFLDALRNEIDQQGARRFSDRTIARIAAHLKTFAKWIHSLRPFRLSDPTEKLRLCFQRLCISRLRPFRWRRSGTRGVTGRGGVRRDGTTATTHRPLPLAEWAHPVSHQAPFKSSDHFGLRRSIGQDCLNLLPLSLRQRVDILDPLLVGSHCP